MDTNNSSSEVIGMKNNLSKGQNDSKTHIKLDIHMKNDIQEQELGNIVQN